MGTCFIDFFSDPTNASVYVNGVKIGSTFINDYKVTTPTTLDIRFTKSGYEDYTISNYKVATTDLVKAVRAVLLPEGEETGEIRFRSSPTYAKVYLDNNYEGRTTEVVDDLPPGRYFYRIEKSGYEIESDDVRVRAGERTEIDVDLEKEIPEPTIISVTIKAEEKGTGIDLQAKFYIDGNYQGYTPKTISIEPGDYTLKVKLDGYKDFVGDFNAKDQSTYFATLEKIEVPVPPEPEPEPEPPIIPPVIPPVVPPIIPPEEEKEEEDLIEKYLPYGLIGLGALLVISQK